MIPLRTVRALLSVSDKTGIVELARALERRGVALLSTGGTAMLLRENGIELTEVSSYTGFPEMMGGRVKTLHPKIHGGILGRREQDGAIMQEHEIDPIDYVVVNLYPFADTVAHPECTLEQAVENIDIGGPAMVRAAAKNHAAVAIVTDPEDYPRLLSALAAKEGVNATLRFELAVKAFEHTARYDGVIASYLGKRLGDATSEESVREESHQAANVQAIEYSRTLNLQFYKVADLRYGENPHQSAAFYREKTPETGSVSAAVQLQGRALSYNNIADTDAALLCVQQFAYPACVIVKHANPCGVAECESMGEAYTRAWKTDPTSAFGGIIAFNRELEAAVAQSIIDRQFVEVIIAPAIATDALAVLAQKQNIRVLDCGRFQADYVGLDYARVNGGLLVQQRDVSLYSPDALQVVTTVQPSDEQMRDVVFAWKIAKFVKSNAIVYCKDNRTIGIGAGQMSRVYSAKLAAIKASDEHLEVTGAVMASDAFFPFRDGIDAAAQAGIHVVVQPGGSINDAQVIEAANEHGMAMVFTGMRHFRH